MYRKVKRVNPKISQREIISVFSSFFPFHCNYMRRWDLTESIGDHFAIHVNQTLLGCMS